MPVNRAKSNKLCALKWINTGSYAGNCRLVSSDINNKLPFIAAPC